MLLYKTYTCFTLYSVCTGDVVTPTGEVPTCSNPQIDTGTYLHAPDNVDNLPQANTGVYLHPPQDEECEEPGEGKVPVY